MTSAPSRARILVVDDDRGIVDFVCDMLTEQGYQVCGVTSPHEALQLTRSEQFELVLTDVEMPGLRGVDLLTQLQAEGPGPLVLVMTAFGSIDLAVQTVRAGACDFLTKPFKIEVLYAAIERALRERQVRREVVRLSRTTTTPSAGGELVTKSPVMKRILDVAQRAARGYATILLTGETGTGKSSIARFIHEQSARCRRPFVQLNCATLSPNLIESELFGVRKGAFTDARESRPGLLLSAAEGTFFLDEVAELPLEVQAKLLYVLESGRVRPVGDTAEHEVRARIIAATNRPLEVMLKEGRFRADLYYRLNVIRIEVPPLRERPEDLPPLLDLFLGRASARAGRPVVGISAAALKQLQAYPWPGNVREVQNRMERLVTLIDHDIVLPEDLELAAGDDLDRLLGDGAAQGRSLADIERAYIQTVLQGTGGNRSAAARILDIDRRTLYRKVQELGEDPE